jgi:hypothetical protein
VQHHFAPRGRLDPWLQLGAGYRFLWEDQTSGPRIVTHGFELAHVRAGVDLHGDAHFALGPVVGIDATLFQFQSVPNEADVIRDPRVSSFVYAGLQGRFDVGGKTSQ